MMLTKYQMEFFVSAIEQKKFQDDRMKIVVARTLRRGPNLPRERVF